MACPANPGNRPKDYLSPHRNYATIPQNPFFYTPTRELQNKIFSAASRTREAPKKIFLTTSRAREASKKSFYRLRARANL
jgi:hypothetical protein